MNFVNSTTVSTKMLLLFAISCQAVIISLGNNMQELPSTYFSNTIQDNKPACPETGNLMMGTIQFAAALVKDGNRDNVVLNVIGSMGNHTRDTLLAGIVKRTFNNTLSNTDRIIKFLNGVPCSAYIPSISTLFGEMSNNGYEDFMEMLLLESVLKEECKTVDEQETLKYITVHVMRQKDKILQSFAENIGNMTSLRHGLAMGRVYDLFSKGDNMTKYIPEIVTRSYPSDKNRNITLLMSTFSFIDWLPYKYQEILGYNALVNMMKANGELQGKECMLLAFHVGNVMKYSGHEFDYNYNDPRNIFKDVLEKIPVEFKNLVWPGKKCEIRSVGLNKTLVPSKNYSADIPSTPVILLDDASYTSEVVSWDLFLAAGNLLAIIKMGGEGIHNAWNLRASDDGIRDNVTACKPPKTYGWWDAITWHIEPVVIQREPEDGNRNEIVFTVSRLNKIGGRYYLYAKEFDKDDSSGDAQYRVGTRYKDKQEAIDDLYWKLQCKD